MQLCYKNTLDNSLFYITDLDCADSQKLILHHWRFYKIFWARQGETSIKIDGYLVTLKKNQLLFCAPIIVVEWLEDQHDVVALLFNRNFYCIKDNDWEVSCQGLLFYGSCGPSLISLNEDEKKNFMLMYEIIKEEFRYTDRIQGEMLRVLLKRIIIASTRLIKRELPDSQLSSDKIDLIRRFNMLVEDHFREKHLVAQYASMLNKSPKSLSTLFKKYNRISPLAFINERIVVEAKRLLLFSDNTAEEIGYKLGFREPGHFSKFFKNQVGTSPIEFRKSEYSIAS